MEHMGTRAKVEKVMVERRVKGAIAARLVCGSGHAVVRACDGSAAQLAQSARDAQILQLSSDGWSTVAIGHKLGISDETARQAILRGLKRQTAATAATADELRTLVASRLDDTRKNLLSIARGDPQVADYSAAMRKAERIVKRTQLRGPLSAALSENLQGHSKQADPSATAPLDQLSAKFAPSAPSAPQPHESVAILLPTISERIAAHRALAAIEAQRAELLGLNAPKATDPEQAKRADRLMALIRGRVIDGEVVGDGDGQLAGLIEREG